MHGSAIVAKQIYTRGNCHTANRSKHRKHGLAGFAQLTYRDLVLKLDTDK